MNRRDSRNPGILRGPFENPDRGRLLDELDLGPTGRNVHWYGAGGGEAAPCRRFELELDQEAETAPAAMAA